MKRLLLSTLVAIVVGLVALHLFLGRQRCAGYRPDVFEAAARDFDAEIVRDRWGVPHVFARRDADVAFGLAYAHAEDDIESYESMLPVYRGRQGLYEGFAALPGDYLIQLLRVEETVRRDYERVLGPEVRAVLEGYAAGLNYFAARHPERVDRRLYPVEPQDIVAGFSVQHLFFYGFDQHLARLFEQEPGSAEAGPADEQSRATGSNAFAVAPARSADGATRIVLNSHQPLTGPVAWYESHLASEEGWNAMGGLFPGMPVIAVGYTPDTAWSATVNKPDLVDVYELEIDPEDSRRYRLDGEWRDFEVRSAELKLKLLGNLHWTFDRDLLYSEHGPVVETDRGFFALRFAGYREIRQVDQWYRLNKARSLAEWKAAMRLQAVASLNFVYADREGNIFFVHNSSSPIRSAGHDWQGVLPGDDSSLIWTETLAFDDLPQIENPASGFVHSANQTPFRVTSPREDLDPGRFPEWLGLETRMTNRAWRGLELLEGDEAITREELEAIKHDTVYSERSRSYRYVSRLFDLDLHRDTPRLREARTLLEGWNRRADVDNSAAPLAVCVLVAEWEAEQAGREPPAPEDVFRDCVDDLYRHFGTVEVPWGDVNRLVRGELSFALNGGPDTLRAIHGEDPDGDGVLEAIAGDGLYMLVEWGADGTRLTRSIHPFGAATSRPESDHYSDQAELFAKELMKTTSLDESAVRREARLAYRVPFR